MGTPGRLGAAHGQSAQQGFQPGQAGKEKARAEKQTLAGLDKK